MRIDDLYVMFWGKTYAVNLIGREPHFFVFFSFAQTWVDATFKNLRTLEIHLAGIKQLVNTINKITVKSYVTIFLNNNDITENIQLSWINNDDNSWRLKIPPNALFCTFHN